MVVPCVAELSDPVNDAMVPRRCSARIKNLKSEQEAQRERQRVRCRSNDDSVLEKKPKVYKKSKVVTSSQAQAPNNDVTVSTVDNDDVTITNVAAPNDCTDHPVPETSLNPQLSGNGTEKSSHARVTETIRRFNKHYLHFVQEEEIRCGRVQADQKTKKNSKSKEAEDDGKRSSKRPDLKAISKMISEKEVLNRERIGSLPGIDVGHQFFSRAEMVVVGFHNHWLNGIDCVGQSAGKKGEYKGYSLPLAVSIVVSGQYEDDQDNYEEVVYTGQGGNDLLGNKRQIKDQVMERGNLGLKNCMEQSVPVRVTRGHRCVNSYVGKVYTYDGLYKVVNYWAEKGISGFTVYKFRLKRIEGQPVLTTNQIHQLDKCQWQKEISYHHPTADLQFWLGYQSGQCKTTAEQVISGDWIWNKVILRLKWWITTKVILEKDNSNSSTWVRIVDLPLHLWSQKVFKTIGDCCGGWIETEEEMQL
ncbi:hypothetical protein MTR67_011091 [Solanum verrucosum]|uniref:YDG domain-containing protein n=1 Tax=Solanum verrucosum TaxID=315347 RepID=A0AAF0TFU0_SOLVR|nr:hypothetical protein MTR67_011091 [Solanum verrucosum]